MNPIPTSLLGAAASCAALCLLPGAALAALSTTPLAPFALESASGPSTSASNRLNAALAVLDEAQTSAGERAYRLAVTPTPVTARLDATALAIGSRTRPTASTLSLWAFITTVRAQQSGERFVILEANTSLLQLAEGPVAPVPLPAAAWLMLAGLMGLAGSAGLRLRRPLTPALAPAGVAA
ncbi:hypothetical protein [Rubrivivax rivuli]|uniref:Uncharacterized protein n=1 Tax=Rubrivivax rivuli TaxID=1862385 RepID=A0A437RE94_9BURK|nr:hypothetical protein [Rubrivivax rivuli]RVU45079.1 hypothetical protein EOE66_13035 [Rubrivivax rivuli]